MAIWGALGIIVIYVEFHECPILSRWTRLDMFDYVCMFVLSSQIKLWVQVCCNVTITYVFANFLNYFRDAWLPVAYTLIPGLISPCVWSSSSIESIFRSRSFRCKIPQHGKICCIFNARNSTVPGASVAVVAVAAKTDGGIRRAVSIQCRQYRRTGIHEHLMGIQ